MIILHYFSADQTIAETKGRYDSSTVTIRMDLCKLENENSSLKSEIESKVKLSPFRTNCPRFF